MSNADLERLAGMLSDLVGQQYASARKSDSQFWADVKDTLKSHTENIDSLRLWRSAITAGIGVIVVITIPLIVRSFNSLESGIAEVKTSINKHIEFSIPSR
jgi:hypothetical protein